MYVCVCVCVCLCMFECFSVLVSSKHAHLQMCAMCMYVPCVDLCKVLCMCVVLCYRYVYCMCLCVCLQNFALYKECILVYKFNMHHSACSVHIHVHWGENHLQVLSKHLWQTTCSHGKPWSYNHVAPWVNIEKNIITLSQIYTVEPLYNEDFGTMKITLLYQVSHYIREKNKEI